MASLAQSIFSKLPIPLQNTLLSAYGVKLRKLRYSGRYAETVKWLCSVEFADRTTLQQIQQARLKSIVDQALLHTPYYIQLADRLGISASDIDLDNLVRFPILEKSVLKGSSGLFRADNIRSENTTIINTSGTSGSPLDVMASRAAIQENYAFFTRFLAAAGVSPFDRSITFAGRMIVPTTQNKPPFHRFNAATNTYLFSSYHLADENLAFYIQALERINPVFIDAYPSAIGTLARYINTRGIRHSIALKAVITSSETLTDQCRAEIELAFNCKVYDQYGCAEMACFIYQCDHGVYHSAPEYGVVEVVDDLGNPVPDGVEGDFVLTGFVNPAMPLIRYRIGDRGALSSQLCGCGRSHPVVSALSGRADDMILTPEGNLVGRMDPLFKGLKGLVAAQIIQQTLDTLEVLVVANSEYSEKSAAQLIANIAERVGPTMRIMLTRVEDIPRSKNGKLRAVISMLPKSEKNR